MTGSSRGRHRRSVGGTSETGSVSLEYVIIFPVVLLIIFGVVQGAYFYFARDVARHAAEVAAQETAGYGNLDPGAGQSAAMAFIAQTGNSLMGPTVTVTTDGEWVTATVSGTAPGIIELIDLGVTQTVRTPVERWTTGGTAP